MLLHPVEVGSESAQAVYADSSTKAGCAMQVHVLVGLCRARNLHRRSSAGTWRWSLLFRWWIAKLDAVTWLKPDLL